MAALEKSVVCFQEAMRDLVMAMDLVNAMRGATTSFVGHENLSASSASTPVRLSCSASSVAPESMSLTTTHPSLAPPGHRGPASRTHAPGGRPGAQEAEPAGVCGAALFLGAESEGRSPSRPPPDGPGGGPPPSFSGGGWVSGRPGHPLAAACRGRPPCCGPGRPGRPAADPLQAQDGRPARGAAAPAAPRRT